MVEFAWLVEILPMKDVWKCVMIVYGDQYVTPTGVI